MTEEYRRYLASPAWQKTRQRAFAYHGRYCAACGATRRLQIHHLTYERLGRELMSDFRVLCKACHKRGRYSSWEIERDRKSLALAHALELVFFLPFRLLWLLLRFGWRKLRRSPKNPK